MKTKLLLPAVLLFIFTTDIYSQSPEQIARNSMDAISIESFEMLSTLVIHDARGNQRVRKLSTANRKFGDTNKTLMRFTSPSEVEGTSVLIYNHDNDESDMWIYMPAIRRVRRIAGDDKANNFMGSEFKNSDMTAQKIEDFNYKKIGTANVDGKKCWKIEAVAKNTNIEDSYGFSKQISYIEQSTNLARKVEYYDFNGNLERVQKISEYKKQSDGNFFAFKMEMKNEHNGRKSVMTIDAFQVGSEMPESAFSPAALES